MASVSKKVKITFWISTILVALMLIPSIFTVNLPMSLEVMNQLGISAPWFRYELDLGKTLGGVILLLPFINGRLKEWVYVAVGIDFISASIALGTVGGPAQAIFPLICLGILALSYTTYHTIKRTQTPWY